MNEKRKRSSKKRIVSILICIGVVWLVYAGVMNWLAWHFAREISLNRKNLSVVPTTLEDTAFMKLTGARIERFGFSFQVPWGEIERESNGKSFAVLSFREGAGVLIFDPESAVDSVRIMRGTTTKQLGLMTSVLGSRALSSNYGLMEAAVSSTPSDVKWWAGRSRNVRSFILLMNKSTYLHDADVIYPIRADAGRGFQYGDPSRPPYRVDLDLFDEADRPYTIWITCKSKTSACITQPQVNSLVASLRRVPSGSDSSAPSNGD